VGPIGADWVESLPRLINSHAKKWSLTILPPYPNLDYHYVTPVLRADGSQAVLKAGIPDDNFRREIAALQAFDGDLSVRILESNPDRGIFLMERLNPGTVLTRLCDAKSDSNATSIAGTVMGALWRLPPDGHTFSNINQLADDFDQMRNRFPRGAGPIAADLVDEAITNFRELIGSAPKQLLLHGNLNHDNILCSQRAPGIAINPKGVIGEPAYETAAIIRNLWPDRHFLVNPKRILRNRINQLAEELELDRQRVYKWAITQSVLSAWWGIRVNDCSWEQSLAVANLLRQLKE
jgi:streptomycin 6-kinase